MEPVPVYSSAHMRERDKILEQKHQKALKALENKIDWLKRTNNDLLAQLFDAQNRSHRLATSLGFSDATEAQNCVDDSDHEAVYKESLALIETLRQEVKERDDDNASLGEKLLQLEAERDHYKAVSESYIAQKRPLADSVKSTRFKSANMLSSELILLQERYDDLVVVKERAAERFKIDYKKWREWKDIVLEEWLQKNKRGSGAPGSAKSKADFIKRLKLLEAGPDIEGFNDPITPTPTHNHRFKDKENIATPTPEARRRPAGVKPMAPPKSSLATLVASSNFVLDPESSVGKVTLLPPSSTTEVDMDFHVPSSPLFELPSSPSKETFKGPWNLARSSSDTEEDSQAIDFVPNTPPVFKIPTVPASLATSKNGLQTPKAGSSTHSVLKKPARRSPLSSSIRGRAVPLQMQQVAVKRRSDIGTPSADEGDSTRAHKHRRISDESDDKRVRVGVLLSASLSGESTKKPVASTSAVSTSTPTGTSRQTGDYSAFKGRGRYAKDVVADEKPINALFTIDPERNGGLDYQFDEVVRKKDDRKRMEAGDCECCRDYYEAIGPLPARLQAPLWRSPPNTPTKPCSRHHQTNAASSSTSNEPAATSVSSRDSINSHKQAISRHRHTWARGSTPPAYWNIGFPSTQEAADINEQAKEMHQKKKEEIQFEANKKDGRYKRR